MLRGRSANSPPGGMRAGCTPRNPNASNYDCSKPVPPSCRSVCAVKPRPTAWEGARYVLPTTQPRQVRTARRVHQAATVLSQSSSSPRRGKEHAPRCWAANKDYSKLERQNSANARDPRAFGRIFTARYAHWSTVSERAEPQPSGRRAAELSRCWCREVLADGVWRSAPRVVARTNHAKSRAPSPNAGAPAPWAVGRFSTGRYSRGSHATDFKRVELCVSDAPVPWGWLLVVRFQPNL